MTHDPSSMWALLRDEILALAEGGCTDLRVDLFEVIATQLALGTEAIDHRALRMAVYRHGEQGATEEQLLAWCDQFFAAVRKALPRSIKLPKDRELILAAASHVCREAITVTMLAAVERALRMRDILLSSGPSSTTPR